MKLKELIQNREIYQRLYANITNYDRIVEIDEKIVEPMMKALEAHDKMLENFKKRLAEETKDKSEEEKQEITDTINQEYQKELDKDIKVEPMKVTKEEAKLAGFNVFEYRQIKHLIK